MLTLKLKRPATLPIEVEGLTPDSILGQPLVDLANRKALIGNESFYWGELFSITGDTSEAAIRVNGDSSSIKCVGRGMKSGRLIVDGSVGLHAGSEMTGGELIINGDSGDWLGAEMRGGLIRVSGNAGNFAGSAYSGSTKGMRNGTILICGNAGDELGCLMRRGIIAVGGSVGAFAGASMIAGTIFVNGQVGKHLGAGMKRGTIIAGSGKVAIPSTFRLDCEYVPCFWSIFQNELARLTFKAMNLEPNTRFLRYRGDLVSLGLGELLIPC